jgi:hypothetical protein
MKVPRLVIVSSSYKPITNPYQPGQHVSFLYAIGTSGLHSWSRFFISHKNTYMTWIMRSVGPRSNLDGNTMVFDQKVQPI